MEIKKIYISGKITGLPVGEVIAKFKAAQEKIRRFGFDAVNPLDNGLPHDAEWADQMGEDIKMLLRSDAIYLLADYEQSEGALIELCVALQRRMPVFVDASARRSSIAFNVHTIEEYGPKKA